MSMDRIRYSHPNPDNIGKKFIGDLGGAPDGQVFTQQSTGTLGASMRAVVPVFAADGSDQVVAMVSVGITIASIDQQLRDDLELIGISALLVLGGRAGRHLAGRPPAAPPDPRARRSARSPGCTSTTRPSSARSARACCCSTPAGRVQLVNDEARRLLDLPDDVVGRPLAELGLAPGLVQAALGRTAEADDIYLAGDRVLVVSSVPRAPGRAPTSVPWSPCATTPSCGR